MRSTTTTALALTAAVALTACGGDDPGTSAGQEQPSPSTPTVEETTASPAPGSDDDLGGTAAPTETGTEEADRASATPSASGTTVALDEVCESDRFRIRYPDGWWTNPGAETPECRYFHPTEVEVQNESLHYAVFLTIDNVAFDRATEEDDRELHREEFEVAGHRAVEVERESDGRGLIPEGTTSTHISIELGDQTVILSTHTIGDTDYERDADLLRRMAETITFRT